MFKEIVGVRALLEFSNPLTLCTSTLLVIQVLLALDTEACIAGAMSAPRG